MLFFMLGFHKIILKTHSIIVSIVNCRDNVVTFLKRLFKIDFYF